MQLQKLEQFKMETSFEGLISILAKSLYAEADVFLRELCQNAQDGIERRKSVEPNHTGEIHIDFSADQDRLVFRDNGIGLDAQDIKLYVSVIGSSGTGTFRRTLESSGREGAERLIGTFGIGMLSAFVVAEKVVVRTRKLGHTQAFAWHNAGSLECSLYADDKPSVGTEVEVYVKPEFRYLLDERRLQEAVVKYCDLLPSAIYVNGRGPVNSVQAPWHRYYRSRDEEETAYAQYITRRYPRDIALDIIPIQVEGPVRAHGALYISDARLPDIDTPGVVDIYVRRMFVRANDATLLPPYAKFVRGVIDSPDLQPTTARDNIQHDAAFDTLQAALGDALIRRLAYLAAEEPDKFETICRYHSYHLKGMAWKFAEFGERVSDLLLWETNRGLLPLRRAWNPAEREADGRACLFYFTEAEAADTFNRLADARGLTVINAGRIFEEELLRQYAAHNSRDVRLIRLNSTDDPALFERLSPEEQTRFEPLEMDLEGNLRRQGFMNVRVQMRRFLPEELPAIVISSPEADAEASLEESLEHDWAVPAMRAIVQEVAQDLLRRSHLLSVNVANPLVQRLATADRREALVQQVMVSLYCNALLNSHQLTSRQKARIERQLLGLLNAALDCAEQLKWRQLGLEDAEPDEEQQ